jgi:hypothetical protein
VAVTPTGKPGSADALVVTSRQTIPAPNNPKGTLVMRFGGASSEIVVGGAELPILDPAAPAETPVEQSAPPAAGPETPASVPAAPAELAGAQAVDGSGPLEISIGDARTELRDAAPSLAPFAPGPPEGQEIVAAPPEATLRPATGVRATPVVPDLATTGALFSLLAFGGLGLLFATRLHRFRVIKVRG